MCWATPFFLASFTPQTGHEKTRTRVWCTLFMCVPNTALEANFWLQVSWPCVLPSGSSENVALACLAAHRSLQNPLPPGKLVGQLDNPVEPGQVLGEALAVSKAQVPYCALLLGLIGKYLPPPLPLTAQFHMLIHVALVHEALAAELAGVPRLATVHGLLVSVELHPAVKHLTTQCTVGLQTILPPLEVVYRPCRVEELVTRDDRL